MNGPRRCRIYTKSNEIIDPSHTALVAWDVQNALVDKIFNKKAFLNSLKSLLKVARSRSIPIIYTKITPLPKGYESPPRVLMFMRRFGLDDPEKVPQFPTPGTPEEEIHSQVGPQEGNLVLSKNTASVFIGTNFEIMMRNRGVETIIFTGISTEMGVSSSARDSVNRGFYTVVVEDCVSSSIDKELNECALKILERICIVLPSVDLMKAWKQF